MRASDGFTAAECAEIAKAYARAELQYADKMDDATWSECEAWMAKFAEWEKGQ